MSVETIPALFLDAVTARSSNPAFRHKRDGRYVDVSHAETFDTVDRVSRGLTALGLAKGDRVALLSENRVEWAIADLSILSASCINVPIYPTLPTAQIAYILLDSEARAVFVSSAELLAKIQSIRNDLPNLQHVIVFEGGAAADGAQSLDDLRDHGAGIENAAPFRERIATIGKYDWASIIYTSGTTGDPKGAILNHWNFVSNVHACLSQIDIGPGDSCLSFLPLSHVFERTVGYYMMLHSGATIAYAESIDTVPQNLVEVGPTILVSVPRLYEKMYARILEAVKQGSSVKQSLFFWALRTGKRYVRELLEKRTRRSTRIQNGLADRLVFTKLRKKTGGRLRMFVSGGAPLAREIAEFFYAAGLPILEGYGLTETSPVICVNTFEHFKFGTVGRPIPGADVRIAEDGEIVVRGPNVMLGYYKKPDQTREALDGEWFHTGDIGHLDDDGFLTITDRKKDIIVTAGGKNVAPQPIENLFKTSKYVSQAVVVGNRRKFISALIVPDFDQLKHFARAAGIATHDAGALVKNTKVLQKIQDEIDRLSENLAGFERVKKIILIDNEFTIENDELTPTLKVKRRIIEKKYEKEIDALYESV